jgi:hypothetical protein
MTITAHFNGQVFVPDESVDLPVGYRVSVVIETVEGPAKPLAGLLAELQKLSTNPDWPPDGAAQHGNYLYDRESLKKTAG